ncbi:MAG TPA: hypothetical protein VGF95_16090, partial [Solirubrobacteraceae bacterium]
PDVPITSFELKLPEGPDSALAANANLCETPLSMPTVFKGHNGAVIEQHTPIEVEGCPAALAIRSHRVKQRTLTLGVYAPSAGKLEVSGKGLTAETKESSARKLVVFKVHERKAGGSTTKVSVVFTPSTGKSRKRQTKTLAVQFKSKGRHVKHGA